MEKYLILSFFTLLTSCAVHEVNSEPLIIFEKSEKVALKMVDLFPDYKNESEIRELLEITFSSDTELFALSLKKSTTLRASIGLCNEDKHMPEIAFNAVFLDGKTIEYYLISNSEPSLKERKSFQYQLYLNFDTLQSQLYKKAKLCAEIIGSSYGSKFRSNKIELPLVID
ncbi:hypothetical protein [Aliiglaciecola litoralis]|uniref:Lipoprotein n=1 Tax=Aliiglaciecola litoralis TaxID=582857 RepID=A0ABN1LIV6_9ALTE